MRMVGNTKKRYELDAIGHLYASTISERYNPIFRIQINLTDAVDAALLQQSVNDLRARYPYLYVGMKKGIFSYYFEKSNEHLRVVHEQTVPLQIMSRHIVCTFQCMLVLWTILGNEAVEYGFHIYPHIRICIFINAQSATRMLAEYIDDACLWQLWQLAQDLTGHQMESAGLRF